MARSLRIDYPGAWHHVMHRGARKAPIFKRDEDCLAFLECLGDAAARSGLEIHAYALMPNHFHLLVRSPRGTLSRGMKYLLARYVQRLNESRGWDGPMFRGRFRSQLINRDDYLRHVMAYIHLNPVAAHLVTKPDEECWTSYRAHLGLESRPEWLESSGVRTWFGGAKGLATFVKAVQVKREAAPEEMSAETGFFAGDEEVLPPKSSTRAVTDDEWRERVCAVTGASRDGIMRVHRGRGANVARRFAVVALAHLEALSHSDVARILGITTKSVGATLFHERQRGVDPRSEAWHEKWPRAGAGGAEGGARDRARIRLESGASRWGARGSAGCAKM